MICTQTPDVGTSGGLVSLTITTEPGVVTVVGPGSIFVIDGGVSPDPVSFGRTKSAPIAITIMRIATMPIIVFLVMAGTAVFLPYGVDSCFGKEGVGP
jgi:hypothetical protein